MTISTRLQVIADLISENSKVIDCGCDHGLLSIYLASEKNCDVLATDINENALGNAIRNIEKYKVSNVTTKLTDGIEGVDILNYDTLVIAGMGTSTIEHILDNKKLCDTLILSSQREVPELREYMMNKGYHIEDEKFVDDRGKKYVIIKFKKGTKKYSKQELEYGPILINNMDYLLYELERLFVIKEEVKNSSFILIYKNGRKIKKVQKLIDKALANNINKDDKITNIFDN